MIPLGISCVARCMKSGKMTSNSMSCSSLTSNFVRLNIFFRSIRNAYYIHIYMSIIWLWRFCARYCTLKSKKWDLNIWERTINLEKLFISKLSRKYTNNKVGQRIPPRHHQLEVLETCDHINFCIFNFFIYHFVWGLNIFRNLDDMKYTYN